MTFLSIPRCLLLWITAVPWQRDYAAILLYRIIFISIADASYEFGYLFQPIRKDMLRWTLFRLAHLNIWILGLLYWCCTLQLCHCKVFWFRDPRKSMQSGNLFIFQLISILSFFIIPSFAIPFPSLTYPDCDVGTTLSNAHHFCSFFYSSSPSSFFRESLPPFPTDIRLAYYD